MKQKIEANFYKYQALGNDMVIIDPASFPYELSINAIQRICQRHFGIGADGICYGPLTQEKPRLAMRFFNPDGSEAEKSGNGLRIFARYLWDAGYVGHQDGGRTFTMYINDEPIPTTIEDDNATKITTTLGRLSFSRPFTNKSLYEVISGHLSSKEITAGATAVNIGNPHCVLFVEPLSSSPLSAARIKEIGPLLETAAPFPNRTNVQLVQIIDSHTIQIEIWERGAGYTLASGTSATASAAAAIWNGRCKSPVEVQMAGGVATVSINDQWLATLTGPVQPVFSGILAQSFIEQFSLF